MFNAYTGLYDPNKICQGYMNCEVVPHIVMSIDESIDEITTLFSRLKICDDEPQEAKMETETRFEDSKLKICDDEPKEVKMEIETRFEYSNKVKFVLGHESPNKYNLPQGEITDFIESNTNSLSLVKFLLAHESSSKYNLPQGKITDFIESNTNSLSQVKRKKGLQISAVESPVKKQKLQFSVSMVQPKRDFKISERGTNQKLLLPKKSPVDLIVNVINENMNNGSKKLSVESVRNIRVIISKIKNEVSVKKKLTSILKKSGTAKSKKNVRFTIDKNHKNKICKRRELNHKHLKM